METWNRKTWGRGQGKHLKRDKCLNVQSCCGLGLRKRSERTFQMLSPSGSTKPRVFQELRKAKEKWSKQSPQWMSQVREEGRSLKVMVNFGPYFKAVGKSLNKSFK